MTVELPGNRHILVIRNQHAYVSQLNIGQTDTRELPLNYSVQKFIKYYSYQDRSARYPPITRIWKLSFQSTAMMNAGGPKTGVAHATAHVDPPPSQANVNSSYPRSSPRTLNLTPSPTHSLDELSDCQHGRYQTPRCQRVSDLAHRHLDPGVVAVRFSLGTFAQRSDRRDNS